MSESNLSENKYKNWVFTWNADETGDIVDPHKLENFLQNTHSTYVFQKERGDETFRSHYQGCFTTKIRKRQSTILKEFDAEFGDQVQFLTINRMLGTWEENYLYCTKEETRTGDVMMSSKLKEYSQKDINFLHDGKNWYPWQTQLASWLFKENSYVIQDAPDREVVWITDRKGNAGKSKFTKFLCSNNSDIIKVPFGSAAQIRSAVIAAGPRRVYLIDIPRTLCKEDSLEALVSALEDVKNGHITTSFYGKYDVLLMDPTHVVIFSNMDCPRNLMSSDRWSAYTIDREKKCFIEAYEHPKAQDPTAIYYGEASDYEID